ncbi:MAG: GntR family transcriptional regulator [Stellaceae bacterium]
MALDPALFRSFRKPEGRRIVVEVHDLLRGLIRKGSLAPGLVLSQVELARLLGVSRTPVREALRMLQEGGMVSAEPNMRCRVLGFDPSDIEALYMKRILMEALAVGITTVRMTPEQSTRLGEVVTALAGDESRASFETWSTLHREFHRLIVSGAGSGFAAELLALELRSERYQSAYRGTHLPRWWARGEIEHRAIYDAVVAGDATKAAELAARHLARTALELLAALAPEHDTSALRTSLIFASSAATALANPPKSERLLRRAGAR